MSKENEVHYLVGSDVINELPTHLHAANQEEAVKKYVNGENEYDYQAEEFDMAEVMVVPMSKVKIYRVETIQPTEFEVRIKRLPQRT